MITFEDSGSDETYWDKLQRQKEASDNLARRRSIILGIDPLTGGVVSVPGEVLDTGHAFVCGRSEAAKTSGSLLPIARQLIRSYKDASGHWAEKSLVCVLDLKGDNSFFHAMKAAAESDCRSFRYLSSVRGSGYYFLDPFEFFTATSSSVVEIATDWVRALGLDNGLVYAGKYFTDQNVVLLIKAFKEMLRIGGKPSIGVLSSHLTRYASKKENQDAKHIQLCLSMLAEYAQVNLSAHKEMPTDRMDFGTAIEKGDVLYFHLEINQAGSPLRQIAALALTTLVQAAKQRRRQGLKEKPIYVIVDEFFHIAGKAFGDLLATCREWGIHFILACQTLAQLKSHDPDLPAGVMTNTKIKQFYSGVDREVIEFLRDASGQTIDFSHGMSSSPNGESFSVSEKDGWYLNPDAIRGISDHAMHSILLVDDGLPWGKGKRARRCRALHSIPYSHHVYYHNNPLPSTPNGEVPIGDVSPGAGGPVSRPDKRQRQKAGTVEVDAEAAELNERMAKVFAKLSSLEAA